MIDTIIQDWNPESLIYEVALKEGYSLTCKIEPIDQGPADTWKVTDSDLGQSFIINLSEKLSLDQTNPLNLGKEDLFICRDSALDDETAANLMLQCRLKVV